MTTTQKLTHIKAKLREISLGQQSTRINNKYDYEYAALASENWIEMIEGLELDILSGIEIIKALASLRLEKTITRWENVYGEIKKEETR